MPLKNWSFSFWMFLAWLSLFTGSTLAEAGPLLALPPRPEAGPGGRALATLTQDLTLAEREAVWEKEILSGNVPGFLRQGVPVTLQHDGHQLVIHVMPDYLAVGSESDALRTPLTPGTAGHLAERLGCSLPTPAMVDAIHRAAPLKLTPNPRPPGPDMTTVAVFFSWQESTARPRLDALAAFPWGTLTAGHQKDVVRLTGAGVPSGKVAIYGWHRQDGSVIQPLYTGHAETWVDYSHGIRLVGKQVELDGQATTLDNILTNPATAAFLSEKSALPVATDGEIVSTFYPEPGVECHINRPTSSPPDRPVRLVIYAAPNGNTAAETLGRLSATGPEWRHGIQHIAAQTRWLRHHQKDSTWVLAVLACEEKSWPSWCRKHQDSGPRIAAMVSQLRAHLDLPDAKLTLTGHSGGGAWIFRYLDSQEQIPDMVERLVFLDSNYAYDAAKGHATKLTTWLNGGTHRCLNVTAYHDSIALLNGKTFVSESGGTWGRSHAMLKDLSGQFAFSRTLAGSLVRHEALAGRLTFLLMENPDKAVLHTRLVERNGYLHSLLTGTPAAEKGYTFFGEPAYRDWIAGP